MRGRQVFMDSLVAHGVDCIFGNPGTTESPLLDSLIDYPQIAYYVALHEGVAVCAASFYAKASKRTAVANLHVAPDVMEQETEIPAQSSGDLHQRSAPAADTIEKLVELILSSKAPAIVTGDDVAGSGAHRALTDLAEQTGASVYLDGIRSQISIANSHPNLRSWVGFEAGTISGVLAGHDLVMLIGGPFFEEVWFDAVGAIPEGAITIQIEESPGRLAYNFPLTLGVVGHLDETLTGLNAAIRKTANADFRAASESRNQRLQEQTAARRQALDDRLQVLWDTTPMSPARAMHEIGSALPENAVVVDESVTALLDVAQSFEFERPGDYYAGRGGGIGQGVAGALGVKVAHPDRPVVALSGDGSAMYSIQALWTAAHHDLEILFVIISNREYRVLKHNLDTYRLRFDAQSNRPYPHMDLTNPVLGFAEMARGMGVQAKQVSEPEELRQAVRDALAAQGPYLLDVVVSGKQ